MKKTALALLIMFAGWVTQPLALAQSMELVPGPDYLGDCSGCTSNQKLAKALFVPDEQLLYQDNTTLISNVDLTDFWNHQIVRYQVTLIRLQGQIYRSAMEVPILNPTVLQNFADADAFVDTLFLGPGEDYEGADPVPIDYPSAFELVGDNGYQQNILSSAVMGATMPWLPSTIGNFVQASWTMLLEFLNLNPIVVVEAEDGTIILVKAEILDGGAVRWTIIEDGLRLADGNIIHADWLDDEDISFSGSGISIDQLYNGMTELGFDIELQYLPGDFCEYEFECDDEHQCTLTAIGC